MHTYVYKTIGCSPETTKILMFFLAPDSVPAKRSSTVLGAPLPMPRTPRCCEFSPEAVPDLPHVAVAVADAPRSRRRTGAGLERR